MGFFWKSSLDFRINIGNKIELNVDPFGIQDLCVQDECCETFDMPACFRDLHSLPFRTMKLNSKVQKAEAKPTFVYKNKKIM